MCEKDHVPHFIAECRKLSERCYALLYQSISIVFPDSFTMNKTIHMKQSRK